VKWSAVRKEVSKISLLAPTRMSAVTGIECNRSVVLFGHDQPTALVLHNETDLRRVWSAVTTALALRNERKETNRE
jgi:hypothetical protein